MQKLKKIFDFFLILIISIPSFLSLLNSSFFSMHDDQHIARLFLLDNAINQGYFYPRWVDILGFNFGYPLYNFYPPLVYYVAEFFHLFGFSLTWSIKLTFILGFILSAYGIFLLAKKFIGRNFGIFASVFYTYFFYHGVLIYVRGALSEFFSFAILPFVFLSLDNLKDKPNIKNSILFGMSISALILTHPLIAFPTVIYIIFFLLLYLLYQMLEHLVHIGYLVFSGLLGLGLSAFYWLPSMLERKFTLVNNILITELASYKLHFICNQQLLISNWGYGGSIAGCFDGMTFQIGKTHILALLISIVGFTTYAFNNKKNQKHINYYLFFLFLTVFSLFMTTEYSSFIWKNISYLSYLQFPWRFLTFAGLFISITSAYGIYLLFELVKSKIRVKNLSLFFIVFYSLLIIVFVGRYFVPQKYINKTDKELTSFEEIAWRVSRSTFEFSPKGIATTKSPLNTTIPNIRIIDIVKNPFKILSGKPEINVIKNNFNSKEFYISTNEAVNFRLNTFNFPGWRAYMNDKALEIKDDNDFKLITIKVPKGEGTLRFAFESTNVRTFGTYLSVASLLFVVFYSLSFKFKKIKS